MSVNQAALFWFKLLDRAEEVVTTYFKHMPSIVGIELAEIKRLRDIARTAFEGGELIDQSILWNPQESELDRYLFKNNSPIGILNSIREAKIEWALIGHTPRWNLEKLLGGEVSRWAVSHPAASSAATMASHECGLHGAARGRGKPRAQSPSFPCKPQKSIVAIPGMARTPPVEALLTIDASQTTGAKGKNRVANKLLDEDSDSADSWNAETSQSPKPVALAAQVETPATESTPIPSSVFVWANKIPKAKQLTFPREDDEMFKKVWTNWEKLFSNASGLEEFFHVRFLASTASNDELLEFIGNWCGDTSSTVFYDNAIKVDSKFIEEVFKLPTGRPTKVESRFSGKYTFSSFSGEARKNGFSRNCCLSEKIGDQVDFLRTTLHMVKDKGEVSKGQLYLVERSDNRRDYNGFLLKKIQDELTRNQKEMETASVSKLGYHLPLLCEYAREKIFGKPIGRPTPTIAIPGSSNKRQIKRKFAPEAKVAKVTELHHGGKSHVRPRRTNRVILSSSPSGSPEKTKSEDSSHCKQVQNASVLQIVPTNATSPSPSKDIPLGRLQNNSGNNLQLNEYGNFLDECGHHGNQIGSASHQLERPALDETSEASLAEKVLFKPLVLDTEAMMDIDAFASRYLEMVEGNFDPVTPKWGGAWPANILDAHKMMQEKSGNKAKWKEQALQKIDPSAKHKTQECYIQQRVSLLLQKLEQPIREILKDDIEAMPDSLNAQWKCTRLGHMLEIEKMKSEELDKRLVQLSIEKDQAIAEQDQKLKEASGELAKFKEEMKKLKEAQLVTNAKLEQEKTTLSENHARVIESLGRQEEALAKAVHSRQEIEQEVVQLKKQVAEKNEKIKEVESNLAKTIATATEEKEDLCKQVHGLKAEVASAQDYTMQLEEAEKMKNEELEEMDNLKEELENKETQVAKQLKVITDLLAEMNKPEIFQTLVEQKRGGDDMAIHVQHTDLDEQVNLDTETDKEMELEALELLDNMEPAEDMFSNV